MRGSEWLSIKRCLAITQRLHKGPATTSDLLSFVLKVVGHSAYPSSATAREKAFKRDRENLRARLGVKLHYSPSTRLYTLIDDGIFLKMPLPEEGLQAISFLSNSFEGHIGKQSEVQELLNWIVSRLPDEDQRNLGKMNSHIYLDLLTGVDPNHVSKKIWTMVWKAVKSHRKLNFNYLSPRYGDRKAKFQEAIPYRIQYQSGHWYLRAYRLYYRDGSGVHRHESHVKYRLSYILEDDSLSISPTRMADPPAPPRYFIQYRLLPPLSHGIISQRFDDMEIEPVENGSVLIKGYHEDVFEAGRILLTYGEFCVVEGGTEMLNWMKKTIQGMAANYPTMRKD
jgi:hypothetical protein